MSLSKRPARPSAGNLNLVLKFAQAVKAPDGQGGFSTLWVERGEVWACPHKLSTSREKWREGMEAHERVLGVLIRANQSFTLPDRTACLDWKVLYQGFWCKLVNLEPYAEFVDFTILHLVQDGAVITTTIDPETVLFYDGAYSYNGERIYQ